MTDPQFGFFRDDTNGFFVETALFERAVSAINDIRPAFVVITGDFVNDRSDMLQWNEFTRITSMIDKKIPVYLVPGNHDIGQDPSLGDIELFREKFGNDRFSFSFRNSRFIGINSCIIKSGIEQLEKEQYAWLVTELERASGSRHIVVFTHHPFFVTSPDEPETYSNIAPEKRMKYITLFSAAGADAIYAGHYHNNGYGKYGDLEMITTSAAGRPLAGTPSGLRIVKVYNDDIESMYFSLDSIPGKIFIN
jgi:3',5'-cyclic AMP phosphodiesterase CpdA